MMIIIYFVIRVVTSFNIGIWQEISKGYIKKGKNRGKCKESNRIDL